MKFEMVRFQIKSEGRGYLTDSVERQRKEDKQTCLHSFLSKQKALYSHQTIQRRKMRIFDCISCFPSQKQVFPYRYL